MDERVCQRLISGLHEDFQKPIRKRNDEVIADSPGGRQMDHAGSDSTAEMDMNDVEEEGVL